MEVVVVYGLLIVAFLATGLAIYGGRVEDKKTKKKIAVCSFMLALTAFGVGAYGKFDERQRAAQGKEKEEERRISAIQILSSNVAPQALLIRLMLASDELRTPDQVDKLLAVSLEELERIVDIHKDQLQTSTLRAAEFAIQDQRIVVIEFSKFGGQSPQLLLLFQNASRSIDVLGNALCAEAEEVGHPELANHYRQTTSVTFCKKGTAVTVCKKE